MDRLRCCFKRSSTTRQGSEGHGTKEGGSSLKKRCMDTVREQRSRFYILR
ncbi:hypothetical protein TIFTF001_053839, partial [Ficus carica]